MQNYTHVFLTEIEPFILVVVLTNLRTCSRQKSPVTNGFCPRATENKRKTSGKTEPVTGISTGSQCSAAKTEKDFVDFSFSLTLSFKAACTQAHIY